MVLQQSYDLGQSARSYAKGTLDDPRLADDAALEGESPSLTLAQRPHDLETLDRGVGWCKHELGRSVAREDGVERRGLAPVDGEAVCGLFA